jgi:cobalt-zinc-cadmium efflux system protein
MHPHSHSAGHHHHTHGGHHHAHGAHHAHGGHSGGHGYTAHQHGDSDYRHSVRPGASRALIWSLVLVSSFALLEFAGGLWSGSLALLADSGHLVTDAASLVFSLIANILGQRPASSRHSFGLARAEVIAAFVNSLILLAVVAVLVIVGIDRIRHPVAVNGQAVSIIAMTGIGTNLLVAWILSRDSGNLNIRAAMLHVLGDLLGSMAALIAGIIVMTTGYTAIDPLLSMLVGGLILRSTFGVLRESTQVLLDGVPADVDFDEVGKALAAIPGVLSVHDLHVWSMVPGQEAVSAHLLIDDIGRWSGILHQARDLLDERFKLTHVTLQPECFHRAAAGQTTIALQPVTPAGS